MKASQSKLNKLARKISNELGELAAPYTKTETGQDAVFLALSCALVAQGSLMFCEEHLPDAISKRINAALLGCHE